MSKKDKNNLVWLDMEMSGLNPETDKMLELAVIITDSELNILAEAPIWVCHQSDEVLNQMDDWNKNTHGKSGLIDKVKASTLSENDIETAVLNFVKQYVGEKQSPLCGNSIGQDRRFLVKYLPKFEDFLHYRNLDVSTLKELCKRWKPEIAKGFQKQNAHTALADIKESIQELKYYREHFIVK